LPAGLTEVGGTLSFGVSGNFILSAVKTVQPALAKFYDGLSDEQKARFNTLRSVAKPVG